MLKFCANIKAWSFGYYDQMIIVALNDNEVSSPFTWF